jgi:hypothetical protein
MDAITAFLTGIAIPYIAKLLNGAVSPFLSQTVIPNLITKIKLLKDTYPLNSPELLKDLISDGTVKPGQLVEGMALFSFYADSHAPEVRLPIQINLIGGALMQMAQQGLKNPPNPPAYILPTTRFPLVHDSYRIGFLYPENLFGFGVPMFHDGTVRTLPFLGKLSCVVRAEDSLAIDNCVVKYRARVVTLPKSDVLGTFPGLTDDAYERMLQSGLLNILSTIEQETYIERFTDNAGRVLVGSHFLETHWEQPHVIQNQRFAVELQKAIHDACKKADLPVPRFYSEKVKKLNLWAGANFTFTLPNGFPYFHFQANTDLNNAEVMGIIEESLMLCLLPSLTT